MENLNEFGIKPVLLLAQVVNFFILLFLLNKFLFKPILKVLEERKEKIAESIANSEKIQLELKKISEEYDKKILLATKESKKIIEEATASAGQIIEEAHFKAQIDIDKMIIKAGAEIKSERDKLHQEIRSELADLVSIGMQKVAGKMLDTKDKKDLIAKSLKEFES